MHIQKIEENTFNKFSTIGFFEERLGFGKYESFHLNSLLGLTASLFGVFFPNILSLFLSWLSYNTIIVYGKVKKIFFFFLIIFFFFQKIQTFYYFQWESLIQESVNNFFISLIFLFFNFSKKKKKKRVNK